MDDLVSRFSRLSLRNLPELPGDVVRMIYRRVIIWQMRARAASRIQASVRAMRPRLLWRANVFSSGSAQASLGTLTSHILCATSKVFATLGGGWVWLEISFAEMTSPPHYSPSMSITSSQGAASATGRAASPDSVK
eukprot:scaffold32866_cov101-Isochrysis_galbana.AAC.2